MIKIQVGDTVRLKGTRINLYWFSNVGNRLYSMEVPYGTLEKV